MAEKLHRASGAFNGCFGCGSDNAVGLGLEFEREGDVVVSRPQLGRDYAGYRDFVHGGVVATMLDEAMGWAMLVIAGRHGVTRSLNVAYRRPVSIDKPLVLRARVEADEGSSVSMESTLEDDRGRLLARAQGEWVVVREERAAARPIEG